MIPVLYESTELEFETQGLGSLTDAISCEVEEERNSTYDLTMEYPITGIHYSDIIVRRIILAQPNYTDDPQPFRIYKIERPLNGIVTIHAHHVCYDLSDFVVSPFTATGITLALSGLTSNLLNNTDARLAAVTLDSNISNQTSTFKTSVPGSMRSWFGGREGSLIDVFGGEWKYDKWSCYLASSRGANRGVKILYGKNLTELDTEIDTTNVYTHAYAYWVNQEDGTLVTSNLATVIQNAGYVRILNIDMSEKFDEEPEQTDLDAKLATYIQNHNLTSPLENVTIDFVQLDSLQERVDLCDTVTIAYTALGVNVTTKCIRTKWDVLKDRYVECEFGEAKNNIADTVVSTMDDIKELKKADSKIAQAMAELTEEIANAQGFYTTKEVDQAGATILYMHNKSTLATSNVIVKITAETASWSTDGGTTWNAVIDASGRGIFQHLYTVGIDADYITTGIIQGNNDSNYWNLDTGSLHIANGEIDITTNSDSADRIKLTHGTKVSYMAPNMVATGDTDFDGNGKTADAIISQGIVAVREQDSNDNFRSRIEAKLLSSNNHVRFAMYDEDYNLRVGMSDTDNPLLIYGQNNSPAFQVQTRQITSGNDTETIARLIVKTNYHSSGIVGTLSTIQFTATTNSDGFFDLGGLPGDGTFVVGVATAQQLPYLIQAGIWANTRLDSTKPWGKWVAAVKDANGDPVANTQIPVVVFYMTANWDWPSQSSS